MWSINWISFITKNIIYPRTATGLYLYIIYLIFSYTVLLVSILAVISFYMKLIYSNVSIRISYSFNYKFYKYFSYLILKKVKNFIF